MRYSRYSPRAIRTRGKKYIEFEIPWRFERLNTVWLLNANRWPRRKHTHKPQRIIRVQYTNGRIHSIYTEWCGFRARRFITASRRLSRLSRGIISRIKYPWRHFPFNCIFKRCVYEWFSTCARARLGRNFGTTGGQEKRALAVKSRVVSSSDVCNVPRRRTDVWLKKKRK